MATGLHAQNNYGVNKTCPPFPPNTAELYSVASCVRGEVTWMQTACDSALLACLRSQNGGLCMYACMY